jgi:hypothetical protein
MYAAWLAVDRIALPVVDLSAATPFGLVMARVLEPQAVLSGVYVEYADQAPRLHFAQFRINRNELIFEGDAPSINDKKTKKEEYYSTRVILRERTTGTSSVELALHIRVHRDSSLSFKFWFFLGITVAIFLLLVASAICLTKTAEANQNKIVEETSPNSTRPKSTRCTCSKSKSLRKKGRKGTLKASSKC